jgi:hypothetical protein
MANMTFDRITKTMVILLALCFVLSVTVASVNAATFEQENKFYDHEGKYKDGDNYGQGYKDGDNYRQSFKYGYDKGYIDGNKDCSQYGRKNIIRKIPDPSNNDKRYRGSFNLGYTNGYHEKRYTCLKNK